MGELSVAKDDEKASDEGWEEWNGVGSGVGAGDGGGSVDSGEE